jgi:tetratricopeptide (TPR) repeat protein
MEAICLKAMAKEPKDRYETADDLAADIEHWLADEPVVARPDNVFQRVSRWMRHHRSWTRAAAVTLVTVAIVSTVSAFLVDQARKQAVRLAHENERLAAEEAEARDEAVRRLVEAREAVDTWLTGANYALQYYPGVQRARQRMLEKAAQNYSSFAERHQDDVDLETERGRTLVRLGDVRMLLGENDEALRCYESACQIFGHLLDSDGNNTQYLAESMKVRIKLGTLHFENGDHAAAEQVLQNVMSKLVPLAESCRDDFELGYAAGACRLGMGHVEFSRHIRYSRQRPVRRGIRRLPRPQTGPEDAGASAEIQMRRGGRCASQPKPCRRCPLVVIR